MRVVMLARWAGFNEVQYEKIRKAINWEGNVPKGMVFHVSSFDKEGAHVVDIWESADDFNNFVQTRLMPGSKAAGIQGEPVIEIYPVHAIFAPAL